MYKKTDQMVQRKVESIDSADMVRSSRRSRNVKRKPNRINKNLSKRPVNRANQRIAAGSPDINMAVILPIYSARWGQVDSVSSWTTMAFEARCGSFIPAPQKQ
jgi:hypothetical protein